MRPMTESAEEPAPDTGDLDVFDGLSSNVEGVQQARRRDDGRSMLVIMEDGNVHLRLEALFDDKTVRRRDVFEIDAAKGGAQIFYAIDERFRIAGIHLKVDGVDIGEALKKNGLASMTGFDARAPRSPGQGSRCRLK